MRQQAAGVPLVLTDTPRIRNDDRSALRKALARWAAIDDPTLVVLPIEPWWLREGLACLTEEVRAAGRPVAIVLLHRYNGLDTAGAVAGLLRFISDVGPLPVVLLRCDLSAVGAVAHGAFGGFVGWSANTRHGPLPMRRPDRADGDDERDDSPSVFVPALHSYVKTSNLPALARHRPLNALRCGDPVCRGDSLLRDQRSRRARSAGRPDTRGPAQHGLHRADRAPYSLRRRPAGRLVGSLPRRSRQERLANRERNQPAHVTLAPPVAGPALCITRAPGGALSHRR